MAELRRETLSTLLPLGTARRLGFISEAPSGYVMPNGRLYTYYNAETVKVVEGQEEPEVRRIMVVTDGAKWYIGTRLGRVTTSLMLKDMVDHGISNGSAARYSIQGRSLLQALNSPDSLPEIETHEEQPHRYLADVNGHSFE